MGKEVRAKVLMRQALTFGIGIGITSGSPGPEAPDAVSFVARIRKKTRPLAFCLVESLLTSALDEGCVACFRLVEHPMPENHGLLGLPRARVYEDVFDAKTRLVRLGGVSGCAMNIAQLQVLTQHFDYASRIDIALCRSSDAVTLFEEDDFYNWTERPLISLLKIAEFIVILSAAGSELQLIVRSEFRDKLHTEVLAAAERTSVPVLFKNVL